MKTFVSFIQSWGIMFMFSILATSIYIYLFIGNSTMDIALVPQNLLITFVLTWIQYIVFSRANESNIFTRSLLFLLVVLGTFTGSAALFGWFDIGNGKLLILLVALVILIYIIVSSIYRLIHSVEAKQLNEELANYKRKKAGANENH